MKKSLKSLFKKSNNRITILGISGLGNQLERTANLFRDLMILNEELVVNIIHESESYIFNQSVNIDRSERTIGNSYGSLIGLRDRIRGVGKKSGLKWEILKGIEDSEIKKSIENRFNIYQCNVEMPMQSIIIDEEVIGTIVTKTIPSIKDYRVLDSVLSSKIKDYVDYLLIGNGNIYLSKRGAQLIQLYDKNSVPRGIFPRKAFYTTRFKRYSIWGFIFNRKGDILLHQRSKHTKDNRLQWDKSIGGHVEVEDSSTVTTARRELIEELFLPNDENTLFVSADIGQILNFGDWNVNKRPESSFTEAFNTLNLNDWVLFQGTDGKGNILTVDRISKRKLNISESEVVVRKTHFMSDVFFFISPEGFLDTEEEMYELTKPARKTGAAEDHKIMSVQELSEWVLTAEEDGNEEEIFTDDLLYIVSELKETLIRFSEFVKYSFYSEEE